MASNRYKVPSKAWSKWTDSGRAVFNELYAVMRDQRMFTHPDAVLQTAAVWRTIRWNAAWIAADTVTALENAVAKHAAIPQPNRKRAA